MYSLVPHGIGRNESNSKVMHGWGPPFHMLNRVVTAVRCPLSACGDVSRGSSLIGFEHLSFFGQISLSRFVFFRYISSQYLFSHLSLSLSLSLSQAIEEFIAKKAVLDIEIGLGSPFPLKGEMLSSNCVRDFPELIIIDDDDNNDGQRYSSRSSTELQPLTLFPCTSSWVISEEDLELRLGFKAHNRNPVTTINFFDDGSEQQSLQAWKSFKRKLNSQTSSSHCLPDGKEVKLRCNICMDTMKEETSTTCGHIFCKQCITDAIRVQKRCPTCRERLSPSNIHRIYLPGATS